MLWERSEIVMRALTIFVLCTTNTYAGQASVNPEHCLTSSTAQVPECGVHSREIKMLTDEQQFQNTLNRITASILENYTIDQSGVNQPGYTFQLAAFRRSVNLEYFIRSLTIPLSEVYIISRNDGWHSVGYGFYTNIKSVAESKIMLEAKGISSWLKPVNSLSLKSIPKLEKSTTPPQGGGYEVSSVNSSLQVAENIFISE